jgi:pyridoxine/pyridoxamine 5'-phosphate oxidase
MDKHALEQLRKSYERAELDESTCAADPLQQFSTWLGAFVALAQLLQRMLVHAVKYACRPPTDCTLRGTP